MEPFRLEFTEEASGVLDELGADASYATKHKKVLGCLGKLETNPRHPGLQSHKYSSLAGLNGEEVWESYVENQTPGAWRVWWHYGPGRGVITVVIIGPHPD